MQMDVSLLQLTKVMFLFKASGHLAVWVGKHPGEDLTQALQLHAADAMQTEEILVTDSYEKRFDN